MKFFQNPERDYVYQLITKYYDNPTMTKVKEPNESLSMYVCQLTCLLMNEKRYLIVLTHKDTHPLGYSQPLNEFRWVSFRVRSLQEESYQNIPIHNYKIKRDDRFMIGLKIKNRNQDISLYETDLGVFSVSLLHTKKQEYEYPNEGNLVSALETYHTVLQWI
jgi:hypothetical protein